MTRIALAIILAAAAFVACSSSSPTKTDAPVGNGDAPGSGTPLTVDNFDSWCSVAVGNNTTSSSPSQLVDVTPGTITLTATALSGFILGDWFGVTGDTGSGTTGTVTGSGSSAVSTATVTVGSTAACVSICCPFKSGSGCPTTNQCPL
jgi:hypothetical protein